MQTIKVDDEVFEYLQHRAIPFVDRPNDVLRRLLLEQPGEKESLTDQHRLGLRDRSTSGEETPAGGATVADMRARAIHQLEAALSEAHGKPVTVDQAPIPGKRGPREQRYRTRGGQIVYLRTRSFDPQKPPFHTMQPATLADADWFIFVCEGRGDVVLSGDELRELSTGLHKDGGGDYKPTFLIDGSSCHVYAWGAPHEITHALNAYDTIAQRDIRGRNQAM